MIVIIPSVTIVAVKSNFFFCRGSEWRYNLIHLLLPHFSYEILWKPQKWLAMKHFVKIQIWYICFMVKEIHCTASHHIRHESFEMLDGLLPLVLLPFSVDLFGLFWSGLLHLPLPFSETGFDASLPFQLTLLLDVHALRRMMICGMHQFHLLCDIDNKDYARKQSHKSGVD